MTFASIPANEDGTEAAAPCCGSWFRNPDGSLTPANAQTAAEAGLVGEQLLAPVVLEE